MEQIQVGGSVKVTVKRTPLSEGARKTLGRVFLKDRNIAKQRRSAPKPLKPIRRGGRIWTGRRRGAVTTVPNVGDSCVIACTLDVARDLTSVKRYVDVSPV
jgi:hypothetical protein